jgi:type III pantothenate kinase
VTPVFVGTTASAGGVVNAYPRPANLGVDRWAALVGARHEYKDAVCVVDCGSAITVDLMDGDGRHRGGLIMPGIEMLKTLLLENTANIRLADPIPGVTLFAQDTGEAVSSGAAYMAVAALERIIAEMAATIAQHVDVVVTGGDAGQILSSLNIYARQDPDLVLKGLAVLSGDD